MLSIFLLLCCSTTQETKKTYLLIMNFIRSLVTVFLFTLLVLRDSIAHTQQALEVSMVVGGNGLAMKPEDALSLDQEFFDGIPALTPKYKKLGGRKMVVDKEEIKAAEQNLETTEITSGKDMISTSDKLIGGFQKRMIDQNDAIDLLNTNHINSQDSETILSEPEKPASNDAFQKPEAKRLLEDTIDDDIANLMRKDYTGMGKGKRKPPIHNSEPMKVDNKKAPVNSYVSTKEDSEKP